MVFVFGAGPSLLTNSVHAGRVLLAPPALGDLDGVGRRRQLRMGAPGRGPEADVAACSRSARCSRTAPGSITQGFVRPMRNEDFRRAWQGPLADAIAPFKAPERSSRRCRWRRPGVQFFLFPTHRLWLEGRP